MNPSEYVVESERTNNTDYDLISSRIMHQGSYLEPHSNRDTVNELSHIKGNDAVPATKL